MRKTIIASLFLAAVVIGAAPAAQAQDRAGIGVGVETPITGNFVGGFPGIATLTYDTGVLQIGGMLIFISDDGDSTILGAGGRIYYAIHRGERSDFSVGGGLGLFNTNLDGPGNSFTDIHVEGGAKIRAFITPNVALTTSVGLGIIFYDGDDNDTFGLIGGLNGAVGVSYYFW